MYQATLPLFDIAKIAEEHFHKMFNFFVISVSVRNLRYEDMIDHRSYTHNFSSCEIKA